MRGIATALGTLPIAGLITLAVPAAADAANGKLIINGKVYDNPSGCYDGDARPLRITNQTDQPAIIFKLPHCAMVGPGPVIGYVRPGDNAVAEQGLSVRIG